MLTLCGESPLCITCHWMEGKGKGTVRGRELRYLTLGKS